MTKLTAVDRLRKVEEGKAWDRAGAWIIINLKNNTWAGKVKVAYPADGAGRLHVFLWGPKDDLQYGTSSGFGYDKLSAAMRGLRFDGIVFGGHPDGHWENMLREAGYLVIRAI